MSIETAMTTAIRWHGDHLSLLDQRCLPTKIEWVDIYSINGVIDAIAHMVVRGAPAIGVTAAYGVVLAARHHWRQDAASWKSAIVYDLRRLAESRPTAVNLRWAIERMQVMIDNLPDCQANDVADADNPISSLEEAAINIHREDIAINETMAECGADLLSAGVNVLTHCNTGMLATGGHGTALGVIRTAHAQDKLSNVYVDETRPWLQGLRLTTWELGQAGIQHSVVCESAAASLFQADKVDWVIVGADRITANGDVANKIGTYSLAVLARHHGVKFMVVAPISTFDLNLSNGADIPIESRPESEILSVGNQVFGHEDYTQAYNPAFDITPAELIDVIVTEKGHIEEPNSNKIHTFMQG